MTNLARYVSGIVCNIGGNRILLTQELKDRVVESAVTHLMELLPLYSVSYSDAENQAIWYAVDVLTKLGRESSIDKHWNIISPGTGNRAVVAHTDTVGAKDETAKRQSIRYNSKTGIIYNRSGFRAMGGDDKVGMAFALAIAEHIPETHVWLVANEEVGLVGSRAIEPGVKVDLAVQLDRRGSYDLVTRITGPLCGRKTEEAAKKLLPHRKDVNGGMTDVMALVDRDIAKAAFNMSCGYFSPHGADEYIVMSLAIQSFIDGLVLLTCLEDDQLEAPTRYRGNYGSNHNNSFRRRETCEDLYGDYYGSGVYGDHIWDDETGNWASRAEIARRKSSSEVVTVNRKPLGIHKTANGQLIDLDAPAIGEVCNIIVGTWVTSDGDKMYRIVEYADGSQAKELIDPNDEETPLLLAIAEAYGDPFLPDVSEGDLFEQIDPTKWVATLGQLSLYQCNPNVKCSNCGEACTSGVCAVTFDDSCRICEDCAYSRGDQLAFITG